MTQMKFILGTAIGCATFALICAVARADNFMIQVDVQGQRLEGRPLSYSRDAVELMLRDGQYFRFRPSDARSYRQTSPLFRSYSAGEMRKRLAAELGPEFSITGTGHYLVAHSHAQKDLWASRFEDLYRNFLHYFSVRGFRLHSPEFPLVAIVWPNQKDFQRHALRSGLPINDSIRGYYYPISNRIYLYDSAQGKDDRYGWQQNADTIIHEVTHQTAFNTGIHTRFSDTPQWLIEGLGTLFEAPGIYDSRQYRAQRDRINQGRLADFKAQAEKRKKGFMVQLISSDQLFERDAQQAYAQAWAMTYWMVETRPRQYSQYLARTANIPPGTIYPAAARMADFAAVFGDNFPMHEARFNRFMAEVK
jgi:hypothetical protein